MPFLGKATSDGRPVDPAALKRCFAAGHKGHIQFVCDGGFGAAAVTDRFLEGLPGDCLYRHAPTGIVCAADARLDNAADLAKQLPPGAGGPAALIAGAYLTYGLDFPARLLGDYAAAVWDPRDHRLILLCDRAATRGLYFAQAGGAVQFAADVQSLLTDKDMPVAVDPERLLVWATQFGHRASLPLKGVDQVKAGHLAVIEAGNVRQTRYWDPGNAPDIRFDRDDDYVEAAEAVLREAVRCRLPRRLKVGCHLSGGLDSPIVVGTAARLLAEQGRRLTTFTSVHTDPDIARLWRGRYWDEHRAAAEFAALFPNIDPVEVSTDAAGAMDVLDTMIFTTGQPPGPLLAGFATRQALALAARRNGFDVMLTGVAGNETLSQVGSSFLAVLLRQARLMDLFRHWKALRRNGTPYRSLIANTVLPLVPGGLHRRLLRWTGRGSVAMAERMPFAPDILADREVHRHVRQAEADLFSTASPRDMARRLSQAGFSGVYAWHRLGFDLDMRSPFLDSRLIDFCAGLPLEQFLGGGENRHLARLLLRRLGAPETLARERRKGVAHANWHSQMMRARPAILDELDALEASPTAARLLDLAGVRKLVAELPAAKPTDIGDLAKYSARISSAIAIGRYIRRMEGGNAGPAAAAPAASRREAAW